MSSDSSQPPASTSLVAVRDLREVRDRAIARLSDGFAHDVLDVDEFERRVAIAHTADSALAIDALVADLPATVGDLAPSTSLVPVGEVRDQQRTLTVLGNHSRKGAWVSPRHLRSVTVLGNTELDFRDARLPAGVIDLSVLAVMGNADIIVPPGLAVETAGSAILGNFDQIDRAPSVPDPGAPLLRVHGLTVFGNVTIKMRLPGEDEGDAWRRQRRERKEKRAQRKLERRTEQKGLPSATPEVRALAAGPAEPEPKDD